MPYSSAYVASTVSHGSFPGFRAAMNPAPSSYASAPPKMNPRASAPRTRSGSRGRAHSASCRIVSAKYAAVRDQRHEVLEEDPLLREVGDVADAVAEIEASSGPLRPLRARSRTKRRYESSCATRGERLEVVERALAALRVARAQAGRDELLDERRLAPRRSEERPQVACVDAEACESVRTPRRCPPRSRGRAARRPRRATATTPYSSSSRRKSGDTPARSPSSAPSISSSRPLRPTLRLRARSADVPGPSSSSRITRSGRNSSRWRRRIVARRSTSSGEKSRYPPRVRLRRDEALVLEVADLGDGDVRELLAKPLADGADRAEPGLGAALPAPSRRHRAHRARNVSRYLPIWTSSSSCEHGRLDALPVDVRAVEAPEVADREVVALALDLGVAARDRHVVEEDLALGRAPDRVSAPRRAGTSARPSRRRSGRRAPGP